MITTRVAFNYPGGCPSQSRPKFKPSIQTWMLSNEFVVEVERCWSKCVASPALHPEPWHCPGAASLTKAGLLEDGQQHHLPPPLLVLASTHRLPRILQAAVLQIQVTSAFTNLGTINHWSVLKVNISNIEIDRNSLSRYFASNNLISRVWNLINTISII